MCRSDSASAARARPGHPPGTGVVIDTDDGECARAVATHSGLRRDAVGQKRLQYERIGCDQTNRAAPAAFLKYIRLAPISRKLG